MQWNRVFGMLMLMSTLASGALAQVTRVDMRVEGMT
jgi:hypothetical protein